jgi:hypothetical protein
MCILVGAARYAKDDTNKGRIITSKSVKAIAPNLKHFFPDYLRGNN